MASLRDVEHNLQELLPSKAAASPRAYLLRNLFSSQLGYVVSVIVAFVISPIVVSALGDTRYGLWSLLMSLTGHYGLLSFGLRPALSRHIAESTTLKDRTATIRYVNSAFILLLPASVVALAVGVLVARFLDRLISIPPGLLAETRTCLLLVAATASITLIDAVFQSSIAGIRRFGALNLIGISTTVVRGVLTPYLLARGGSIQSLAMLMLALTFAGLVVDALLFRHLFPDVLIRPKFFSKSSTVALLSYGYKSFTTTLGLLFIYQCDLLVLARYTQPSAMARYNLAGTLILYLMQFFNTVIQVLAPHATSDYASGGLPAMRRFLLRSSRITYLLSAIIIANMVAFGRPFYVLWIGPDYGDTSILLTVLLLPHYLEIGSRIPGTVLIALGRIGPLAIATVAEGVTNLALSIWLVHHFGPIGVALGTAIPQIIITGIWQPWYVLSYLKIQPCIFLKHSMLPSLIVAMIATISAICTRSLIPIGGWFTLIASACISMSLPALLLFHFTKSATVREPILKEASG
jgi:O-antigen/teichoic acid export membrane protein